MLKHISSERVRLAEGFDFMSKQSQSRYRVAFDYADGQHYDSGPVWMTPVQAKKTERLLVTLEKDERITEYFCGEYVELSDAEFNDLLADLQVEFHPGNQRKSEPKEYAGLRKHFRTLEALAKEVQP